MNRLTEAKTSFTKALFENLNDEKKKEDEKSHDYLFSKKIWKVSDVASFLQCSIGHIYNLSSRDLIPKKKVGKFLFFCPKEVFEWIKTGD